MQPSIPQNPTTAEVRAQELVPKGPGANPNLVAMAGNDNVTIKPDVKQIISKELILYHNKVTAAILDEDSDDEVVKLRHAALASIRSDPGLQQLVPYFITFVAEKVTHSLKNIFVLRQMLELTSALIASKQLFLEPYAHSLAPPVLTCLLGRRLGDASTSQKETYELRDYAASLLGLICKKYAKSSKKIRERLARTCLKHWLDYPPKPLEVQYGAISGLVAIGGPETVRALIVPNLKAYGEVLEKAMNGGGAERENDVRMVLGAVIKALGRLADDSVGTLSRNAEFDERREELVALLGPLIGEKVAEMGDARVTMAVLEN